MEPQVAAQGVMFNKLLAIFLICVSGCSLEFSDSAVGFFRLSDPATRLEPFGYSYGRKAITGLTYDFYNNGQLRRLTFHWLGKFHWFDLQLYPNGHWLSWRSYKMGQYHGKIKSWHPQGQPMKIARYVNGKIDGEAWAWHPNGDIGMYAKYDLGKSLSYKTFTPRKLAYKNVTYKDGKKYGLRGDRNCDPTRASRN